MCQGIKWRAKPDAVPSPTKASRLAEAQRTCGSEKSQVCQEGGSHGDTTSSGPWKGPEETTWNQQSEGERIYREVKVRTVPG